MAAENNVITTNEIKKVREVDYAATFGEGLGKFLEILGVTRRLPVVAGTVLKQLTVSGTLADGEVAEGDIIPLSKYKTEWTSIGEVVLNKYRKATTAEAILKGGFDQAVNETDKKMITDIQKSVRTRLINALDNDNATVVEGGTLQEILAQEWGQLQVLFEDDAIQAVYFVNPLDIADYLGAATITTQTAFGFTYIEDFLGLGTVIVTPLIKKGDVYATAKDNIVDYYVDARESNGLGDAFDFSTDSETGFVGIHEESNYTRLQNETVAIEGVYIFPEMPAGIVKGEIGATVTPFVKLDKATASVEEDGTVTLSATTYPSDAEVTWTSSAESYATVSDGVVTGVAEGSATITATITVDSQDYTDTCAVTVTAKGA